MDKYLVIVVLFQLFYITSCIYSKTEAVFFRKDYRYFESTESFYKLHTTRRNWFDAKRRCAMEGAFLWYPEDQAEVDIMIEFWKKKLPVTETNIYVGISDLLDEGTFETIDGRLAEDMWNNWGPGEPNNDLNVGGQDCAILRSTADLDDVNCNVNMPFICKKVAATIEWNDLCDQPDKYYIYDGTLGKCYKLHKTPLTWRKAHSVCTAEQSYLAVVNSAKEKDLLIKLIKEAYAETTPGKSSYVHLGFHRQFDEGWHTVTGLPLENSKWNTWAEGQPEREGKQDCGAMSVDGLYYDVACDDNEKYIFVCEHDIGLLSNAIDERLGQ